MFDKYSRDCLIEWLRFEVECETFDRTLPGFWWGALKDEWIPHDLSISRCFAGSKREATEKKLRSIGYFPDMWREERRYVSRLTFEQQKELLIYFLGRLPPDVPDETLQYRPR